MRATLSPKDRLDDVISTPHRRTPHVVSNVEAAVICPGELALRAHVVVCKGAAVPLGHVGQRAVEEVAVEEHGRA